MKTAIQKLAEAVYRPVVAMSSMDLALRLSLLLFAISDWVVGGDWQWRFPLRALALAGMIIPGLYKNRGLWLLIALTMFTKSIYNWWTQDNHIFLLTWWSLGVAIALHTAAPERAMATCGRLLVGLSFFFAVVWKGLLSPDFIDGSYFQFAFLTDHRFFPMTAIAGGMSEAMNKGNLEVMDQLFRQGEIGKVALLKGSSSLRLLAKIVTWWTLFIELALAVVYLWPPRGGRALLHRYRHLVLFTFASTTYLVASVETFGWSLLTFSVAGCEPKAHRTRFAYVLLCLIVLMYDYIPLLSFVPPLFKPELFIPPRAG